MIEKSELSGHLCPPLDTSLVDSLLDEFLSLERRFLLRDWEPATLDGGQFCEIISRIIYHIDSGNLNYRKGVNSCLSYVENEGAGVQHQFPGRRAALHLCKVVRTVYKFRSQRGAVHIDPDYTANEFDSTLVLANARWLMGEIIRVFWTGCPTTTARIIRELVRYNVPAVLSVDGRRLVLRTDCTVEEEILILLHDAGEEGMTRIELGKNVPKAPSSITNALTRLKSAQRRFVFLRNNQRYALTPLATKHIRESLAEKLSLS